MKFLFQFYFALCISKDLINVITTVLFCCYGIYVLCKENLQTHFIHFFKKILTFQTFEIGLLYVNKINKKNLKNVSITTFDLLLREKFMRGT